jgi:hypothetical protein
VSAPVQRKSPYGDGVVYVHGSQVLVAVANTATGTAILNSADTVPVNPDSMGGTVAALCNRYTKWFFTRLVFEYVPFQPNSTDGHGFAFGFWPEGATTPQFAANSFANVSQLEHSMVLPMTGYLGGPEMNCLEVRPNRSVMPWLYSELDSATIAGQIQTNQGLFCGQADSAIADTKTWGTIWIHYEIEFCDISPDQGFTLNSLRRGLRERPKVFEDFFRELSLERNEEDEVISVSSQAGGKLKSRSQR